MAPSKETTQNFVQSKLRSFRAQPEIPQIDESFSESDIPDQLVNPSYYSSPNTPLISVTRKDAMQIMAHDQYCVIPDLWLVECTDSVASHCIPV